MSSLQSPKKRNAALVLVGALVAGPALAEPIAICASFGQIGGGADARYVSMDDVAMRISGALTEQGVGTRLRWMQAGAFAAVARELEKTEFHQGADDPVCQIETARWVLMVAQSDGPAQRVESDCPSREMLAIYAHMDDVLEAPIGIEFDQVGLPMEPDPCRMLINGS